MTSATDTRKGYCDACGHYGYLTPDHIHAECEEVISEWHAESPAPLTDGDEHMIINHYRGL
jgi:hypothetical protein